MRIRVWSMEGPWVDVAMLLGWVGGATLLIMVELVLLLFWMALVPSRGRELVLCCLTETAPEALEGIVVRAGFSGLSSSSERRAST